MDPRDTSGKAQLTADMQNVSTAVDATGLCLFLTFGNTLSDLTPLLAAATGIDYTDDDLLLAGERIWNMERQFNLKAGLTAADDTLPPRILNEPLEAGAAKGWVAKLDVMLPIYYQMRGWSADGVPSDDTLKRLGLS